MKFIELDDAIHLVSGICTAAIKNVLTEYLSDDLANALAGEIALEIARAAKEIKAEREKDGEG